MLGIYFLTTQSGANASTKDEELPSYASVAEALMAFDAGALDLQARVKIRIENTEPPHGWPVPEGWEAGQPFTLITTLGRALLNEALPADYPFVNDQVDKKLLGATVNRLA